MKNRTRVKQDIRLQKIEIGEASSDTEFKLKIVYFLSGTQIH